MSPNPTTPTTRATERDQRSHGQTEIAIEAFAALGGKI